MDKKKIIIIILLIAIIAASIIINIHLISNKNQNNNSKLDGITVTQNKEILKDTNIEQISITDVSLLNKDGLSIYKAKVTNNTEKDIKIDKLYVIFYENKKEKKILAISNVIIKTNSTTFINISSTEDLTKSTDIKYIIE